MTRAFMFGILSFSLAFASNVQADLPVAPPPREIRPDGTRVPAPQPEPAAKENPLEVVERIIKNSRDVGDKLAMTDAGKATRKTQEKILKDIESLLNQEDPPPMPDQNPKPDEQKDNKDQNPDQSNKPKENSGDPSDKKQDMMPNGGMGQNKNDSPPPPKDGKKDSKQGEMPPMGGMGGSDPQPMEEPMGGDQPRERRPRQGGSGEKKQETQPKEPEMPQGKSGGNDNTPPKNSNGGQANNPPKKNTGGQKPDDKNNPPPPPLRTLLPEEDTAVKSAWGHLPDKLRQQATQYYQQEFMPRYSELLKMYYSSLSEKK